MENGHKMAPPSIERHYLTRESAILKRRYHIPPIKLARNNASTNASIGETAKLYL